MSMSQENHQWQWLATLRFFLALIVLAAHIGWVGYTPFMQLAIFDGTSAVIGFFLISGYSIAASLERSSNGFYRRRFLRIYPLYCFAIAFSQLLAITWGPSIKLPGFTFLAAGWPTTLCNAVLLQRFACIAHPYNLPLWSISCECFYYLLAPMFFKLKDRQLLWICAASFIFFLGTVNFPGVIYGITPLRLMWYWLLGYLLFKDNNNWMLRVCALASCLTIYTFHSDSTPLLAPLTPLLIVLFLLYTPKLPLPKWLMGSMEYLGNLSYPIYLLHSPALIFGYRVLGLHNPDVLLGVVFLTSIGAYHLIDDWLKKLLFSRRLAANS